MTKRTGGRRRRNRNSSRVPGDRIEVIEGQQLFVNTTNVTVVQVPIQPSSFTRVLSISDNFQYYRCTRLQVIVMPSIEDTAAGATNYGSMAAGYLPGSAPDTPPANEASVLALPFVTFLSNGQTVPSRLNVPRRELIGMSQLKWYKTIAGTPDAQFETQGILYTFGSWQTAPTIGVNFLIKYRFELQGWSLTGNTPLTHVPKDMSKLSSFVSTRKEARRTDNTDDVLVIAGVKYLRLTD